MRSYFVIILLAGSSFFASITQANDQELLTCLKEKNQLMEKANQPMYACAVQSCTLAVGYGHTRDEALSDAYKKFARYSPICSRNEEPVCELVAQ